MKVKLETLLQELSEKTIENNQYPVLTSSKAGIYLQSDYFNKQVASKDNTGYKIIRRGQFTYRAMSDTGEFFPNKMECVDIGIVSPAYPVFSIVNENIVNADYLKYYFKSKGFQRSISMFAQGSTRTSVKYAKLKTITIDLPNMDDQLKMVSVLEKMENVISIRQQALAKYDTLIKARFVEMFGDPILNEKGWDIVTIGDIVTEVRYGTSKPAVEGGKYPYLRMNNLTSDGHLDLTDLKYIDIPDDEIEKCIVRKGDVLFNRTNSIELVGKTAVFDLPQDMVIAGYIIRVRLNQKVLPEVLSQYMNLEAIKDILRGMAKGAVNQANINAQELQSIKVYTPDMELQKQFVEMKEQVDKLKFKRINIIPEGGFHLWK